MTKTLKRSAGLIMYRQLGHKLEVFLVHPGGLYWAKEGLGCRDRSGVALKEANAGKWTMPARYLII
jgi:predicted NUDIX family NTP pyrophosphohydrolase